MLLDAEIGSVSEMDASDDKSQDSLILTHIDHAAKSIFVERKKPQRSLLLCTFLCSDNANTAIGIRLYPNASLQRPQQMKRSLGRSMD